jgi:DNA primase
MSDWQRVKGAYRLESHIRGLKKAGTVYKMCCPFHADKTPSFVVNPETQQWRCFGACATGGDIFTYEMKVNGWTLSEALTELASRANIRLDTRARKEDDIDARLLGLLKEIAHFYHDTLLNTEDAIPAMEYLINERGLNVSDLEAWQIGYAPNEWQASHSYLKNLGYTDLEITAAGVTKVNDDNHTYDRFRHRIMFPIHDDKGRVRGFGARIMPGDEGPKYINSPQSNLFDKSSLIYGLNRVKSAQIATQAPFQVLTVVEGYMDAICAHKWGFKNVCAQMGTALTDKQLKLLAPRVQRLILCLDNDNAGQSAMNRRAHEILEQGSRGEMDIRIATLGTFKDPDEMIKTDARLWTIAMNNARPIVDLIIDTVVADLPSDASVQNKSAAAKKAMDKLRTPDNPMETVENTRKLAVALNLPESVFVEWAAPQLRVLPKASPVETRTQSIPPLETAVLRGMIANTPDGWLQRANGVLICLAPIDRPMPHTLGPLSPLDFTHDQYQHLMMTFMEHGDDIEDALKGTVLEDAYSRVAYKPLIMAAYAADTPDKQPADTYDQFIVKALRLRLNRLKEEMETSDHFEEMMYAMRVIQQKIGSIKIGG